MGPCDLKNALSKLAPVADPRLLVGPDTMDDAAVIKVRDDLAICFTADFITPISDDPFTWGRIAAANSLSDIFVMGAAPLCVLNLVCWPGDLPSEMLADLLAGGSDAANECDAMLVGGHTVQDKEPKYGMAVVGMAHPDKIVRNNTAKSGDWLYLSKPLGTGITATAFKKDLVTKEHLDTAIEWMKALNVKPSSLAAPFASAMTDVTGFGLFGHLCEMIGAEGEMGVDVNATALPLLPGVGAYASQSLFPGGAKRNRKAYHEKVKIHRDLDQVMEIICYDPQTSGGVLCAIPDNKKEAFEAQKKQQGVPFSLIGVFTDTGLVRLTF